MEKERLQKAFNFLRAEGKVFTQKGLAEMIGYSPQAVSGAFHGRADCLTPKFMRKLNHTFGDIFNMEWLLGENVDMLASKPVTEPQQPINLQLVETMQRQISDYLDDKQRLKSEIERLNAEVAALRSALAEKEKNQVQESTAV